MKNLKKLAVLSLAALGLTITACGGELPSSSSSQEQSSSESSSQSSEPSSSEEEGYKREDDATVYERALGDYEALAKEAKKERNDSKRYVKYAHAEAALMDSATFMPTTTQGGSYAMTRVAPRTIPYSMWGNDTDRVRNMVIIDYDAEKPFIKGAERAELIELWDAARKGGDAYDPAAYLEGKGYEIADKYTTTFSTLPATLDILSTSMQADTESLVNAIEGLVEYDNLGRLQPRLANLPVISEDGKTYTFEIREGGKWFTADKQVYGNVTADDFVAGFQHMLDAQGGLEWLVEGVVEGVEEYLAGDAEFEDVGYKVVDNKLQITLTNAFSYFPTMLTYSCFMPMNRAFFLSKGGAFGIAEFKEAKTKATYLYGDVAHLDSMVYNSAFVPSEITDKKQVVYVKNANYVEAANNRLGQIKWVYDDGSNPAQSYNSVKTGIYSGSALSESQGTLKMAKDDNLFDDYSYITDTNATTYFGGFNLNRGTFKVNSVQSSLTEEQKEATHAVMQNNNFRRALQHAWDRKTHNGVAVGEELAEKSLRNMYTAPEFVALSEDVTIGEGEDAHTFIAGTAYGDIVEYYLKNEFNRECQTKDGVDGWYNPEEAAKFLAAAQEEMGEDWQDVTIEIECYGQSKNQVAQAQAFKESIEASLTYKDKDGKAHKAVTVFIMYAANTADYYAAGYRAANGQAGCFDVFYGSGWGPDYGDPSTYLDTFLGDGAGYMTKVIGLF